MCTAIQSAHSTLTPLFAPRSIAVVGAGRRRGAIGAEIFHNLSAGGFRGMTFPVNPHGRTIAGTPAWATVSAIPWPVDLAVIAVPCAAVEEAIDDCIAARVKAIVVISAGFAETGGHGREREAAIRDKVRRAGLRMVGPKPVLATFFGAAGVPESLAPVPCYVFPESAAAALARVVEYRRWRARPAGAVPVLHGVDPTAAAALTGRARATGGGWLDPHAAFGLMEAAGLRTAPIRTVLTAEGAISAAAQAGYPVVLKGAGPTLLHKTEAQAVYTGLSGDESVLRALHALRRRPDVTQVIVQRQITGGVEMFAGALLDPQFGHLVMCGSGGTRLELLRDTSCRLAPLTARGAADMIEDVRGKALLRGFRGSAPVNEAAYRDALLRLSALLQLCPEIEKVDLNPVIVTADAAWVVDARVRIAAGGPS